MGILQLGFLVDFISMPVICGFTNAAAIIIASSQFSTLLGINGKSETFVDAIVKLIDKIEQIRLWDSILGVCCIVILVGLKVSINRFFPGKFCNRLLTEILTEVPISHSLTEFNQPFNR